MFRKLGIFSKIIHYQSDILKIMRKTGIFHKWMPIISQCFVNWGYSQKSSISSDFPSTINREHLGILPMEGLRPKKSAAPVGLFLPSGYVKIAIENGHRNRGFSH